MRRAAKVDASQEGIVEALESLECRVQSLAALGHGVPDLVACRGSEVYWIECKTPKASRGQKLNSNQQTWAERMQVRVYVISTPEQAIELLKR